MLYFYHRDLVLLVSANVPTSGLDPDTDKNRCFFANTNLDFKTRIRIHTFYLFYKVPTKNLSQSLYTKKHNLHNKPSLFNIFLKLNVLFIAT